MILSQEPELGSYIWKLKGKHGRVGPRQVTSSPSYENLETLRMQEFSGEETDIANRKNKPIHEQSQQATVTES